MSQMTPFETEALKLLQSIDQRLKSIEKTTTYFQQMNQQARDAQDTLARLSRERFK